MAAEAPLRLSTLVFLSWAKFNEFNLDECIASPLSLEKLSRFYFRRIILAGVAAIKVCHYKATEEVVDGGREGKGGSSCT